MKRQILIADPSAHGRETLAALLCGEYEICQARSGAEAMALIGDPRYVFRLLLVCLDATEPDSFGVLTFLRDREIHIPTMVFSADPEVGKVRRAYELGAVDYFTAPYDPVIVPSRIARTISLDEAGYIDPLTGEYNRQGFLQMAESYFRNGHQLHDYAFLHFDIMGFRTLNRLLGRTEADKLLVRLTRALTTSAFRPILTARTNIDHFMCLIHRTDLDPKLLHGCLTSTGSVDGKRVSLRSRCGICLPDEHTLSASHAAECAEIACRRINNQYLEPYAYFSEARDTGAMTASEVMSDFDEALEKGQFRVYYQPIVDAETGDLVSAEALIRWAHPLRGFIRPDFFIPVLEDNGYICKLDAATVREVYDMLIRRKAEGKVTVPVSVNLSWMDLYDNALLETLHTRIVSGTLPPDLVRYEVTETSVKALEHTRARQLFELRQAGAKILLDDFGSGYSSFDMLQEHGFDILKIDMPLVRRIEESPKSRSMLISIIEMSHNIGMRVLAEGVENTRQAEFLRENSCDYLQGYLYSQPLPAEDFERYLDRCAEAGRIAGHHKEDKAGERAASRPERDVRVTKAQLNERLNVYGGIFDHVRLLDSVCTVQLRADHEGTLRQMPYPCYEMWNRDKRCDNCVTRRAFATHETARKLELCGDDLFQITAEYVEIDGAPRVIEMISRADDGGMAALTGGTMLEEIRAFNTKVYTDMLTGAMNRPYYEEQLGSLQNITAVAFLDIDHFKEVNDTFGHEGGDAALRAFTRVLQSCVRNTDVVIRYGGDEFVIAFKNLREEFLPIKLEAIRACVEAADVPGFPGIRLTTTIGGCFCDGRAARDALTCADHAMYLGKTKRNTVEIYREE